MGQAFCTGVKNRENSTESSEVKPTNTVDNDLNKRSVFQSPRPGQTYEQTTSKEKQTTSKENEDPWKARSAFQSPRGVVSSDAKESEEKSCKTTEQA